MKHIILTAALALSFPAFAAESGPCQKIDAAKKDVSENSGSWTDLTPDQWIAVRTLFLFSKETRDGLPYGEKAALVSIPDEATNFVYFIDGDSVCDRLTVPRKATKALIDVGSGLVVHAPHVPAKGEENP